MQPTGEGSVFQVRKLASFHPSPERNGDNQEQCAQIVSVKQEQGSHVARVRQGVREAVGTGSTGSLAIIHAAMALFEPETEPSPKTEANYVIETENAAWYRYPPPEEQPASPAPNPFRSSSPFGHRVPYEVMYDIPRLMEWTRRARKGELPPTD